MNTYKTAGFVGLAWIVSVAVAYGVGWWAGVKSAAQVAATAAQTGFSLLPGLILMVAVGAGIVAFQARGYFARRPQP